MLYHYWHDPIAGRTKRESLRTTDLETAKRLVATAVVGDGASRSALRLADVLDHYLADALAERDSAKPAAHGAKLMLEFWGPKTKIAELNASAQREFARWSALRGHSLSYIARNLGVLSAALRHSGFEEPQIFYSEAKIRDKWHIRTKAPRARFIPSDAELGRFLSYDKLPEATWRWAIIALSTGCRPQAAIDLAPAARRRDCQLIDLNPGGRVQNRKHRPLIRETRTLASWLDGWETEAAKSQDSGMPYCGYASVESVQTAIERVREKTQVRLPRLSAYSFRHKVITVLRRASVSEDEIGRLIGHQRSDVRTTAGYGEWAPDYLSNATAALDRWFMQLQRHVQRPLFSQNKPKTWELKKQGLVSP